MPTFVDGEAALSVFTKLNNAILRAERTMIVDDVTQLANLVYTADSQWTVSAGMQVFTAKEGFLYEVLASGASTFDIQPGAVKLDALPGENGSYNFRQMLPTANGSTDDYPLLAKLLAKPINGILSVYFPTGNYRMNSTIELKRVVRFWGDAGFAGSQPGRLTFAQNTTGIVINRFNTLNGDTQAVPTTPADGSVIEGLAIFSAGGTDRTKHGLFLRARATLRNLFVSSFPGNGIHILATAGVGGTGEGNANCFYIESCTCIQNRNHGFYCDGADANAGTVILLDCNSNGRTGVYDSSFLGNTYVGCHTASNGLPNVGGNSSIQSCRVAFGGRTYHAHWNATEAQLVATEPGTNANIWIDVGSAGLYPTWTSGRPEGTYFPAFAYFAEALTAESVFVGCYNELDGSCAIFGPSIIIGGVTSSLLAGDRIAAGSNNQYGMKSMAFNQGNHSLTTTDGTGWLTFTHASDGFPWRLKRDSNGDILLDHANLAGRQVFRVKGESATRPFKFAVNDFLLADRLMAMGTAAPTTGTWTRGDYVRNSNPAVGQPKGWICTVSGTPGTWVSEGNL
jgi:hypothetical protein